jgi:hypothetical protein
MAEHFHGYVLTVRRPDVPPILHRADCPHASSCRQQQLRGTTEAVGLCCTGEDFIFLKLQSTASIVC